MEKQFVPYELALELKELGFDESVLAQYRVDGYLNWGNDSSSIGNDISDEDYKNNIFSEFSCRAPLWQQAFDWFRENHNLIAIIDYYDKFVWSYEILNDKGNTQLSYTPDRVSTYEEARLDCLKKLIEICNNK